MPKVLNVVKLHKKFATLTRSKESIQSLSGWIMHHNEFHEDIVNEWLIGLSKDYNPLVMFYVANDVIQNCGKKRVPEFRDDFAKVLKKAASLEKVKEIKDNVLRLLGFWRERDIYDETFSQEFQSVLNSKEIKVDSDTDEPSEEEVIARYRKETLVADLEKLKVAVTDRIEKEEVLEYAEEPVKPEPGVSLVQGECHDMIEKCEKYMTLVEETINLISREVRLKKVVLEDLKDCRVFYSAQSRDVKEVANMFRIYGKKLKIMEKKIAEKKESLTVTQSDTLLYVPDTVYNSPNSVCSNFSLSDSDSFSVSERIQKASQDSAEMSAHESGNSEMQKTFFALLNKDKSNENSSLPEEAVTDQKVDKLDVLQSKEAAKDVNSSASISEQCNVTPDKLTAKSNKEKNIKDIDILLDESYDCKKINPKTSMKRKAEIIVKLNEKKVCSDNISKSIDSESIVLPVETCNVEKLMNIKVGVSDNINIQNEKDVILEVPINAIKEDCVILEEPMKALIEDCVILEATIKNQNKDCVDLQTPIEDHKECVISGGPMKDLKEETFNLKAPVKDQMEDCVILPAPIKDHKEDCVILEAPMRDPKEDCVILEAPIKNRMEDCKITDSSLKIDKNIVDNNYTNKKDVENPLLIIDKNGTYTGNNLSFPGLSMNFLQNLESNLSKSNDSSKNPNEVASDFKSNETEILPLEMEANGKNTEVKLSSEENVLYIRSSPSSERQDSETKDTSRDLSQTAKTPDSELIGEKPDLMENLQKVLECICDNKQSYALTSDTTGIEPIMSLENCILLYDALCNNFKDIPVAGIATPLQIVGPTFRQNEVVDMDCETDEES